MDIRIKLFALLREIAATDTVPLEVPEGADIAQALAILQHHYPVLEPYLANVRFSLYMEFVDVGTILHPGDELALIPPVSGGT